MTHAARFARIVQSDPVLSRLLEALRPLALPEWRLVSGCLYQTVWNQLTGRPPGTGVLDHDVIYFDGTDLSWDAEDLTIRRVVAAAAGIPAAPQVRNQARVPLWYEARFGVPCPPLRSADEALTLYPARMQAAGVRLEAGGGLDIVAPFGLDDIFTMTIRPNPACPDRTAFAAKAARACAVWPEAVVVTHTDPCSPVC